MAIRAVLWDLGGVLIDWDPRRLYRRLLPDEAAVETFLSCVCTMDWHKRHDAGVPFADNARALIGDHPDKAELIWAWSERWDEMFDGTIEGVLPLFEALEAEGAPQHALTNMPAEAWPGLNAMYPFLARFDGAIVSGREGVIKPDPRIFEIAAARLPVPPQETVFIDDRPENVAEALGQGFDGVVFEDAAALSKALAARGFKVPSTKV